MPVRNDPASSTTNAQRTRARAATNAAPPQAATATAAVDAPPRDPLADQRAIEGSAVGAALEAGKETQASRSIPGLTPLKARLQAVAQHPKVVATLATVAVTAAAFGGAAAGGDGGAAPVNAQKAPQGGVARTADLPPPVEKVSGKQAVRIVDDASRDVLGKKSNDRKLDQRAKARAANGAPAEEIASWARQDIRGDLKAANRAAEGAIDALNVRGKAQKRKVKAEARELVRDGVEGKQLRVQVRATASKVSGNLTAKFKDIDFNGAMNQRAEGVITVNGHKYDFASGGWMRGSLPKGVYTIGQNVSPPGEAFTRDGVTFGYLMENKYDPRVGDVRTELLIHPDGSVYGTAGCIGIQGDGATMRRFMRDIQKELDRNGGSFELRVG